jgi:MFS family permease
MLSVIPTGILADKFGQKLTIQIGLLIDALSMFGLLFVHNPLGLIIFFAFRGISIGFRSGSDEALLYDSYIAEHKSPEGYNKTFGKLVSNDVLGFVIATGVAVHLFGKASYVPIIIITSIATLVALIISFTLSNKKHIAKAEQLFNTWTHIKQGMNIVKQNRTIFALTLVGLLTINGEYFLRQTYQPLFQEMAVPALFLGVALSAIRNAHRLEKFLTVDKILFWLNILLGGSFVLFALTKSIWILVLAFMGIQALLNMQKPIVSDYVNQQIASNQRSTVLSTVSFVENIGEIATRLMLGASIGLIGLGSTLLAQGLYLIIGATIGFWYLKHCGCVHKIKHTQSSVDLNLSV